MCSIRIFLLLGLLQPLFADLATIRGSAGGVSADGTVTIVVDSDRDGLTDAAEIFLETDPYNSDSDGDGLDDKAESIGGTDPTVNQFQADADGGGLVNAGGINLRDGLRAVWGFETIENWHFQDTSGLNFDAAIVQPDPANPAVTQGSDHDSMISKSAAIVGPQGYLRASPEVIEDSDEAAIAFWVRMLPMSSSGGESFFPIFSLQTSPISAISLVYRVNNDLFNPSGRLVFSDGLPGAPSGGSSHLVSEVNPALYQLDDGEWHHVIVTINDQSEVSVRIDNVSNSPAQSITFSGFSGVTGTDALLGRVLTGNTANFFTGELDQFLIYNRALSPAEQEAIFNYDADGDGLSNREEQGRTDPFVFDDDSDFDGLSDVEELAGEAVFDGGTKTFGATNPQNSDTDGDFFDDQWEARYFFTPPGQNVPNVSPNLASVPIKDDPATPNLIEGDYDGDGLSNTQEMNHRTDPNNPDSDGDGINDKTEVENGWNPTDGSRVPLNPGDFFGDESLGSYEPIGDLDDMLGIGNELDDDNRLLVYGWIGETKFGRGCYPDTWRLWLGNEHVDGEPYIEPPETKFQKVRLDRYSVHKVRIEHIDRGPATFPNCDIGSGYAVWAGINLPDFSPFVLCDADIGWGYPYVISGLGDAGGEMGSPIDGGLVYPNLSAITSRSAYLVPIERRGVGASYSGNDAVGPKYRKIGLNGRPLADEKPQQEEESDHAGEETFVDAFNLGLHHDTSFHYMPIAASDLVLQAAASTSETGFSDRSGLKPHERLDLPFGTGWSSNLCSYVEIIETFGVESDDPITVNVVDEAGHGQRFGTYDFKSFFPWPSGRIDKKTFLNALELSGENFTLKKKFGSTLRFEKSKAWFMYFTDRTTARSDTFRRHTYWRLSEIADRYGVRLNYQYDNENGANDVSLIPRRISCPDRDGQFLDIVRSADSRRVESITNSLGLTTSFHYTTANLAYSGLDREQQPFTLATPGITRLESVRYPDQSVVSYTYDGKVEQEAELMPWGPGEEVGFPGGVPPDSQYRLTHYYHTNVKSITDKKGKSHVFHYDVDHSKQYDVESGLGLSQVMVDISHLPDTVKSQVATEVALRRASEIAAIESAESEVDNLEIEEYNRWKTVYGLPLKVRSVDLPDNMGSSQFESVGLTRFAETMGFPVAPVTTVTDAEDHVTAYTFGNMMSEVVDIDDRSKEWMVYYLTMKIHHGGLTGSPGYLGTEEYEFNPKSGLSLKRTKDLSGNETRWDFEDDCETTAASFLSNPETMSKWADPTAKTDELGRKESYSYSEHFRVMEEINDPHGTKTKFTVDELGRRTSKNVTGRGGFPQQDEFPLQRESYAYGNPRFRGFQTGKTTQKIAGSPDPSWTADLKVNYVPDSRGRLWREIVDPEGANLVTEHAYDLCNNRISTTDPRGNRIRFEYDQLNRLTKVIYPPANTRSGLETATKETWYDFNGNKAAEIDEEGHYTFHYYDNCNRLVTTIRDMDGLGLPILTGGLVSETNKGSATGPDLVTTFAYNAVGSLIRQKDPNGTCTRTFYDGIQRPVHVFTGLTETEALADLAGCTAVAAASSEKTHTEFRYTDAGLAIPGSGVVKGNPGSSAFDSSGFKPTEMIRHHAVRTAAGTASLRTYAAYDALYRVLLTKTEYEADAFAVTSTQYASIINGKEGLDTRTTDGRGKITKTETDGLQRTIKITDAFETLTPLASISETFYTSTGLVWKVADPMGRVTETDYDALGRPVVVWQPDPLTGLVNRTTPADPLAGSPHTSTLYDRGGNVTATINPLGKRWDFEYDARNRKILERQPGVTNVTVSGNAASEENGVRPEIGTAYDGLGNVIAMTDARGHMARNFYDAANRLVEARTNAAMDEEPSSDPQNPGVHDLRTLTVFDSNGNAIAVTDANGNVTRNQYDRLNRLIATATNPFDGQPNAPPAAPKINDIVVFNEYDDSGNLTKVTDGENQVTGFRYDGLNRKTRTLWDEGTPVQRTEQATYDGVVQLSRTDPKGQAVTFLYDALNRVSDVQHAGAAVDNRNLIYDLAGNILNVSYPNETAGRQVLRGVSQVFDHLNRLKEETSAGATHTHTYDKAGNRRTTTYGNTGRTLASEYDALNRLLILEEGPIATTYGYDLNGNISTKTLPNGTVSLTAFDDLNRRLSEITRAGGGTGPVISSFDYSQPAGGYPTSHDGVGNVLKIVETYGHASVRDRVVENGYDRTYRLVQETIAEAGAATVTTTYGHDKANNRTSKVVTGGSGAGSWIFAHGTTADGYGSNQLKSVTHGAVVTNFLYDANGNRSEKKVGGSTVQTYGYDFDNRLVALTDSVKGSFTYTYDHRTRRVGRDESAAGGAVTKVSFAGGLGVQEYDGGSAVASVEMIRGSDWGGGVGGVLYTIRGGDRSFNAYNGRGDVVSRTNDSGAITWQSSYEAFGTRTQEQGATQDRQKANTKDEDPTGLLNEGFRYRDLEFGVFITRDPAGFVDGPNVYTYVRQNPWGSFDPDGLRTKLDVPDNEEEAEADEKELDDTREKISEVEKNIDNVKFSSEKGRGGAAMNAPKRVLLDRLFNESEFLSARADHLEGKLTVYRELSMGGYLMGGRTRENADRRLCELGYTSYRNYQEAYSPVSLESGISDFSAEALTLYTLGASAPVRMFSGTGVVAKGTGYSDDLLRAAQKEFPGKAGKVELHHIEPKYLGGDPKGIVAPLDAAYHQQITNEFRRVAPYGQPKPDAARFQAIMEQVYSKYPLPPAN